MAPGGPGICFLLAYRSSRSGKDHWDRRIGWVFGGNEILGRLVAFCVPTRLSNIYARTKSGSD